MTDKSYLITGGTGSFGRAYARKLLAAGAQRVVIFSRDEVKQAEMRDEIDDSKLRFFIGDVRDRDRLRRAFTGVDVVIHAAALKRIEVGHYNPIEMIKTNVYGAVNVIEAAQDAGVRRVVALSTDKAYQPVSPYGQTKALAESLFLNANNARGEKGTTFIVTRYGNVAFSRGSIIPKWKELRAAGKSLTVTDVECTRFYMTMSQACSLVDRAVKTEKDYRSPLLPVNLPAYRLGDLATAFSYSFRETGLPEYEKLHESLDAGYSSDRAQRLKISELRDIIARGETS